MSKAMTRVSPLRRPAATAPTTPPAGPDSRLSLGWNSEAPTSPPALVIRWSMPDPSGRRTRSRYSSMTSAR